MSVLAWLEGPAPLWMDVGSIVAIILLSASCIWADRIIRRQREVIWRLEHGEQRCVECERWMADHSRKQYKACRMRYARNVAKDIEQNMTAGDRVKVEVVEDEPYL